MGVFVRQASGLVAVGTILLLAMSVAACGHSREVTDVVALPVASAPGPLPSQAAVGDIPAEDSSANGTTARPEDQPFLEDLGTARGGLSIDVVVTMAERVCGAFSEGSTAADIRGILARRGLTTAEAARLLLAAVSNYCPEFRDRAMG